MRKQIWIAILSATVGLVITFWAKFNVVVTTKATLIQPMEELSLMSNPYLPIQELQPIY